MCTILIYIGVNMNYFSSRIANNFNEKKKNKVQPPNYICDLGPEAMQPSTETQF